MATDEDVIVNIDEVDEEDEEQQTRNIPTSTSIRKRLRSSIEEEPSSSYSMKISKRNIQQTHPPTLDSMVNKIVFIFLQVFKKKFYF